jgi:hypothetical protein
MECRRAETLNRCCSTACQLHYKNNKIGNASESNLFKDIFLNGIWSFFVHTE